MADRYNMCTVCPKRDIADLFESLGEVDTARRIREAGCGKWRDDLQKFHPVGGFAAETYAGCTDDWIPRAMIVLWHAAGHAAAAHNDARDRILAAGGLPELVNELIGLGIVAVAGGSPHQIGRGDESPNEPSVLTSGDPS